MVTKTITIKEKAYDMLVMDKGKDESFSDEIIRWAKIKKRPDLRQFAGMWSDMGDEYLENFKKTIKNMRKSAGKTRLKELGYDV